MRFAQKFTLLTTTALLLGILINFNVPSQSSALSGNEFNPSRIIDDGVFYNGETMDVSQIQVFLDAKLMSCDTNGSASYSYYYNSSNGEVNNDNDKWDGDVWTTTSRATYGQRLENWRGATGQESLGSVAPYTCLKDYRQNTNYKGGESGLCSAIEAKTNRSAAQIIDDVARACHISQKVIIVMLQKEQGLVTDDWPWGIQYRSAMGYGCPDTAACDSEYYGFFNQVYNAARQFQRYKADPNNWNHVPFMTNQVLYQANAPSCGSRSVYIENYATAGLYNYTPYTPNQAALDNLYGMGDGCSAYGNRNFWRYYNDWFGSTYNYLPAVCDAKRPDVSCVWHLSRGGSDSNFLTTNTAERDSAVTNAKYSYNDSPFYGFTSQLTDTIPVYRLRLSNEHFYTTSISERDTLLQNTANSYEGIAFYMYPGNLDTNASYPIYRLSSATKGHKFVASVNDRDALIAEGYTSEGIAFNAPSGFITAANPTSNHLNVYRISKASRHLYSTSLSEGDSLLRAGWALEGILLQAPAIATSSPVFRLRNIQANSHLLTPSLNEKDALSQSGWVYEGVAWYLDTTVPQTYRFYINGSHFYTSDMTEAINLASRGARYESIAFGYNQSNTVPTYRLFNGTDHFFTVDTNETLSIANTGWKVEGISWYGSMTSTGQPIYRLATGTRHFYTASESERDLLISNGWKNEGIGWYTSTPATDQKIHRLLNGSRHFYTSSDTEKNSLINHGWTYEGVAWYGL